MRRRTLTCLLCLLFLSPLWVPGLLQVAGFRYNRSDSMPRGWYRIVDSGAHARKGDLVTVDPPNTIAFAYAFQRGYLKKGECPLKRLVALPGDRLDADAEGVAVNCVRLPNSQPKIVDGAGRPLPQVFLPDYRLKDGEVLLMSDRSAWSFDGRYFGPTPRAQIQSVVRPVWTW